ncbi:MAG: hypothetical protein OEM39_07925, partial [Acidimicrobiia bacterium]|nr:hypothetical protein [Acidimicrobiia bacterium]
MNPSDDQRFKELTDRLVAMSPEPPPFPEETVVSTPGVSTRRSPVLVFAGAAAAVLLAVGIPLVLLNNQEPPIGAPSTSTTTSTSTPTTDPGDTTTTTVPSVTLGQFATTVYLTQSPENSYLGNPALIAFYTMVDSPIDSEDTEIMKNTLNMLG